MCVCENAICLFLKGIAILSVGAFIHYDAKSAVKLFHNSPEAVSRETLTVLRGKYMQIVHA